MNRNKLVAALALVLALAIGGTAFAVLDADSKTAERCEDSCAAASTCPAACQTAGCQSACQTAGCQSACQTSGCQTACQTASGQPQQNAGCQPADCGGVPCQKPGSCGR